MVIWACLLYTSSLAVRSDCQHRGVGAEIVHRLEQEAKELGVGQIFALTYQKKFFLKCGFHVIEHKELPHKVWTECINCPKFPECDEIAVMKRLDG